jgi:hypothetical protein
MPDGKRVLDIERFLKTVTVSGAAVARAGLAAGLIMILAFFFPRGETLDFQYKVGGIWAQKDLIAPFSFPVFRDEKEYAREVQEAKQSVLMVFERDTAAAERQTRRLDDHFQKLAEAVDAYRRYQRATLQGSGVTEDSLLFARLSSYLEIPFHGDEWQTLERLDRTGGLTVMRNLLAGVLRAAYETGVLDKQKSSIVPPDIALREGKVEVVRPASAFLDRNEVIALMDSRLLAHYRVDNDTVALAYKIGVVHLVPNIRFDATGTEQYMTAAVDRVSRTIGFVQENERVVSKHERITPEIQLKLESYRRLKMERGPATDTLVQYLGSVAQVTLILIPLSLYLFLFRKRVFGNNRKLALVALLILMEGLFAYLSRELDVTTPIEYLIFVPAAAMLLTIIFDSRIGFYGTVVIAFTVAGIRGNDYSIALASLAAGALSVYSVRDMKNRTQLFRSLGLIFLGYASVILALGLQRYEAAPVIIGQLLFALVNAIVSPVLTYGLLIFLERVFRVTTDLTLMELAQFNHPLLRRLAEKAPGTYHHSITMATLAEAAAAAVGANEVLARVGAYFHDIGKIVKPTYFVENQKGSRNRHDKLAPRMSSLIIAAHVKDGMTLAREYGLPEEVVEFIPMHHGTTRMDYFYSKALQLARDSDDETKIDEINEMDYRYPGPKPQTRETGIMMLADAIEAAVRTIDEPTAQRLADAIDELIRKRFEEGELDECPLTLKDLTNIKAAFLSVLVGIYHARVRYPEPPKPERVRRPRRRQEDAAAPEAAGSEGPESAAAGPDA